MVLICALVILLSAPSPALAQTQGEKMIRAEERIMHIQEDVKDIKESVKSIKDGQDEIKDMLVPRIVKIEQWQANYLAVQDRNERKTYQHWVLGGTFLAIIVTLLVKGIDYFPMFLKRLNGKGNNAGKT